jgi:hypothetical protein
LRTLFFIIFEKKKKLKEKERENHPHNRKLSYLSSQLMIKHHVPFIAEGLVSLSLYFIAIRMDEKVGSFYIYIS